MLRAYEYSGLQIVFLYFCLTHNHLEQIFQVIQGHRERHKTATSKQT